MGIDWAIQTTQKQRIRKELDKINVGDIIICKKILQGQ
jgi:hypothetical protein